MELSKAFQAARRASLRTHASGSWDVGVFRRGTGAEHEAAGKDAQIGVVSFMLEQKRHVATSWQQVDHWTCIIVGCMMQWLLARRISPPEGSKSKPRQDTKIRSMQTYADYTSYIHFTTLQSRGLEGPASSLSHPMRQTLQVDIRTERRANVGPALQEQLPSVAGWSS